MASVPVVAQTTLLQAAKLDGPLAGLRLLVATVYPMFRAS
jgi:hypothetical protein